MRLEREYLKLTVVAKRASEVMYTGHEKVIIRLCRVCMQYYTPFASLSLSSPPIKMVAKAHQNVQYLIN